MQPINRKLISLIERKNNTILLVLVSSVICSGTLYSFSLGDKLRWPDERDNCELGKNIVAARQYSYDGKQPTAYRPPGYPLILSFFIFLGAGTVHLRILNFVVLASCMCILHKILKEQSSPFAATIGVVLIACYPVLFYAAGILVPQTIGAFVFLLIILLLTRNTNSYTAFALSGLLFGCLILTIPIFILILFVLCVWFFFFEGSIRRRRILVTVAIAFLPVAIWSARNYAVFDSFLFVSSNSGYNLLSGNSENTAPNAGVNTDISKHLREVARLNLDEIEGDRYLRSKAVEFVLSHKREALMLYCRKCLNYFNYRNELCIKAEASVTKDLVMLATYGPFLLAFVCRIFLLRRLRPSRLEVLFVILYISSGVFYAVFFTRIRFRLPFDFLLIMVVAIFLRNVLRRRLPNVAPLQLRQPSTLRQFQETSGS